MKKTSIVIVLLLICVLKLNAQTPAGLNAAETASSPISIYPSPASDIIYVANNDNAKQLVLNLYDTNGNKVLSKTFRGNTEKIAASQFATGTYTVLVSSNGKMVCSQRIQID